jgi:hypothetical protein
MLAGFDYVFCYDRYALNFKLGTDMSKCVCRFWPLCKWMVCFQFEAEYKHFTHACKFGSRVLLNASVLVYGQTIDIGHITFIFIALSDHPNKGGWFPWNTARTRLGIAGVIHAVGPSSASQKCLSELRSFQLMFYMYIFFHVSVCCNRSLWIYR